MSDVIRKALLRAAVRNIQRSEDVADRRDIDVEDAALAAKNFAQAALAEIQAAKTVDAHAGTPRRYQDH